MHSVEEVSVTGKESNKYAPHHIQSAPTRTANMKGKAGGEDNWSKDREEKHPGSEEDGAARLTMSSRKLRSQEQVESTSYVLDSDSE